MKTPTTFKLAAAFAVSALAAQSALAVTLTSAPFIQAYGANTFGAVADPAWDQTETASINTATTIGDFSFTPTVSGTRGVQSGLIFFDGVLGNGTPSGTDVSGTSTNFGLSITGSYNGIVPGGATNVTLTLYIPQLSIHGPRFDDFSTQTRLYFNETTPGNTGSSTPTSFAPAIGNFNANAVTLASNFRQNVWNPADVGIAGVTSTRTFVINNLSPDIMLDGSYITGYTELS